MEAGISGGDMSVGGERVVQVVGVVTRIVGGAPRRRPIRKTV